VREWYGVRCLFEHRDLDGDAPDRTVYEERVVILRAVSFEEAIELAEREGESYCAALDDVHMLDVVQAYLLADDPHEEGAEVFSLMRSSDLAPDEYATRFFDTGDEHQESAGDASPDDDSEAPDRGTVV